MYQEMLDAAPAMLAKYSESRAAGDAYVTQLGIDMAEREMLLADNLYAKLLTTMMHNTGLSSSKTPTTFLSDVPLRQVPRLHRHLEQGRRFHHHRQGRCHLYLYP
mgnify:CR=1 FL=1